MASTTSHSNGCLISYALFDELARVAGSPLHDTSLPTTNIDMSGNLVMLDLDLPTSIQVSFSASVPSPSGGSTTTASSDWKLVEVKCKALPLNTLSASYTHQVSAFDTGVFLDIADLFSAGYISVISNQANCPITVTVKEGNNNTNAPLTKVKVSTSFKI
jgi:hypothetical protein